MNKIAKMVAYGGISLLIQASPSFGMDENRPLEEATIPRPVSIPIPEIARGHEEIYLLFCNGKLIYTDPDSSRKIELPIAALANPLEGTFDLSRCVDIGNYSSISIHTGYKKGKIAANKDKVEIWFVPRFMVEREINGSAKHLKPIMDTWPADEAPIGIFWTWGNDDIKYYDYLTTQSPENLSDNNLYSPLFWLKPPSSDGEDFSPCYV